MRCKYSKAEKDLITWQAYGIAWLRRLQEVEEKELSQFEKELLDNLETLVKYHT